MQIPGVAIIPRCAGATPETEGRSLELTLLGRSEGRLSPGREGAKLHPCGSSRA